MGQGCVSECSQGCSDDALWLWRRRQRQVLQWVARGTLALARWVLVGMGSGIPPKRFCVRAG